MDISQNYSKLKSIALSLPFSLPLSFSVGAIEIFFCNNASRIIRETVNQYRVSMKHDDLNNRQRGCGLVVQCATGIAEYIEQTRSTFVIKRLVHLSGTLQRACTQQL